MIWIIFCILSSTFIFLIFKWIGQFKLNAFSVITTNYLVATLIGLGLGAKTIKTDQIFNAEWIFMAILIGILFIVMFFILSISTKKAGITISTIASKMSVVIPVSYSIIADPVDNFSMIKISGISIAMLAVLLSIYRKNDNSRREKIIYFPLLLFAGMGIVDSLVKHAQMKYVSDKELLGFTTLLFFISFISGLVIVIFDRKLLHSVINKSSLLWGTFLGFVNFGSIYFLIRALNYKNSMGKSFDSSMIFTINNTGIVVLSVGAGVLLFREKISKLNIIGIILAIIAIILFSNMI